MKLWKLYRLDDPTHYDLYLGFVVRAETADEARHMAGDAYGSSEMDHRELWLDSERTSCDELTADGAPGIALTDFLRG